MISEQEIESLGSQLADFGDGDGSSADSFALIAHLDDADFDAVLTRADDIRFDRNLADYLDSAESLMRLAHATGCPDDMPIFPWLKDRGLAEEVDEGGFRFKKAKPGIIT